MRTKESHYFVCCKEGILLILMICINYLSISQTTYPVSGIVVNSQHQPLQGVTVKVKGEAGITVTDSNGRYTVITSAKDAMLEFTYVGLKGQEQSIKGRSTINVTLNDDATALSDVVVVGYGSQSRATISTSISKLNTKVLENISYPNLASAMQGTLPGVRVQTTSGQPGSAPRVIIRGGTSINDPNSATPLYIVDGIQRTDINDISSEDIESLQVLKDAASTSIYGARASNGVVIITTKSGRAGKTVVNYSYDLTVGKVNKLYHIARARDLLYYGRLGVQQSLTSGYITQAVATARLTGANSIGTGNDLTKNTAFTTQYLTEANKYKLNEGWESMPDPLDPAKTIIYKDTDFQDALFQTAVSHNHHIGLSGGSDKASFNAGVGYMTSDGTVITTRYKRLTLNLNGTLQVRNNMSVYGRVLYANSTSNLVGVADQLIFSRSTALPRTAKYTFEDGTLAPGQQQGNGNPAYHIPNQKNASGNETSNYSIGGNWKIFNGLTFDPVVSLYRVNNFARTFQPSYQNGAGIAALVTTRAASNTTIRTDQYQADATLTYTTVYKEHHLEAKGGISYFTRTINRFAASGTGASTDLIPTLNASSTYTALSNTITSLRLPGYIGRLNYEYMQKYLLTINARFDGSSTFGANHRFGFFPGVSAGWVLNKEKFWNALPQDLVNIKLRASYGVNGNIGAQGFISDYQAQGEYGISTILGQQRYNGNAALTAITIQNPELKWERSTTIDVGADIGLLNNRVTMVFDYYRKVTDNLLAFLTPPESTGFSSLVSNLGSLENKGVELEVNVSVLPVTSKFIWNLSFNAAKTTYKVLHLPPTGVAGNRTGGIQVYDPSSKTYIYVPANGGQIEGYRVGDIYGYKALGIYATDADAVKAPVDNVIGAIKTKRGGDVIWQDTDNNGIIDQRDKVYLGSPLPVWTGGFTNTIGYKNFNLYLRCDYTTGHSIYNYARGIMDGNWQGDISPTQEFIVNGWKKQGDITDVPRYDPYEPSSAQNMWRGNGNSGISSQYVEKGDYLCIRELTLSYSLQGSVLKKAGIAGLRFSVTGNNLHYFTAYRGNNPEDGGYSNFPSMRGDIGRYPTPRNIIFGANVTF